MSNATEVNSEVSKTVNRFDNPQAIFAAVVLGFAGTGVAMGLPLLVGSMAENLKFSEEQLGWLASSDMSGLFFGSVLTSFMVTKINRRYLAGIGLLLLILGNYFSVQFPDLAPLMVGRFAAGLGAGFCYATCTASLSGSHHPARTFSILLFILVLMNAFIFYLFPILDAKWGVNGLFYFYIIEALAIFLVLPLLPTHCDEATDEVVSQNTLDGSEVRILIPKYLPRLCLVAVFTFYILVGGYWAFIERAGVDANISLDYISGTLTWGQIFSISGTALAVVLARRYGQSKPLLIALLAMVVTMLVLAIKIDQITFVFSVFSFSFFWIFIDVFQLGILSNIDHSGKYAALVPASQGAAQAIGPSLAGALLSYQFGYSGVMLLCAAAAAIALLIYIYVYQNLKRIAPDIADAD